MLPSKAISLCMGKFFTIWVTREALDMEAYIYIYFFRFCFQKVITLS